MTSRGPAIADRFDAFLFDLDGVIYVGDGALPDAVESVNRLAGMGTDRRFLTNDPRPTRGELAGKLRDLGVDVEAGEVVTSARATARYLARQGATTAAVVGSEGLETELREAGIEVTDDLPDAAVVGADESTTYADVRRAARHVRRGAAFVGTNPDGSFPTPDGPSPGAGAIVSAVEAAAGTAPTVVGKPEPTMFEMALDGLPSDSRVAVVGDNPATDVLGAHRAGLTGILVAEDGPTPASARDFTRPDATIATLAELFTARTEPWAAPPYEWPDEIRPGVGAVVPNGASEVLLVKRADREQWALPTGSIERCEPVREAVVREVEAETGLRVAVDRLTGVYSDPAQQVFPYPSGRAVHFVTTCFRCSVAGGTPPADGAETLEVGFFDVSDLPTEMLPMQRRWIADATGTADGPAVR